MNRLKETTQDFSLDSLKDMQSVRATFTLPKKTINLLSTVANQLGVKQKLIFDHLAENKHVLSEVADEAQKNRDVLSLYGKNIDQLNETIERGKCMEEFQ